MPNKLIVIAKIGKTHGLNGDVWVNSFCDSDSCPSSYGPWQVGFDENKTTNYSNIKVIRTNVERKCILVRFPKIDTIDAAKLLTNKLVWVESSKFAKLPSNQYYWHQLEGMSVYDTNRKKNIGIVSHLFSNSSTDIMVVANKPNKDIMIPFVVPQVICKVDIANQQIDVDWDEY